MLASRRFRPSPVAAMSVLAPPFVLRPATAGDYAWLWNLKRETMRAYVEDTWGTWDDDAQEKFFRRTYSPAFVQVIVSGGRPAGLLHVEREPAAIFLANIQIDPAFQNLGLGTAVVRSLLDSARALRLPVRLQVLKVNTDAQRLYARLGFAFSGESSTHRHMRWSPA